MVSSGRFEWNGSAILIAVLASITLLVSGLLLTNNEALFLQSDIEQRLFKDNAYLVRVIGHELFLAGTLAWCSVVNGHSSAFARAWAVGLIPNICNKWLSGAQGSAATTALTALMSLYFGRDRKEVKKALDGSAIMFAVMGSMVLLISGLLLTNNEALIFNSDTDKRLIKDVPFLVRGVGQEIFLIGTLAWSSVINGHSSALARWWGVGVVPNICNKWLSGDQGGAVTNSAIALMSLYFGWSRKVAAPTKMAMA